MNNKKSRVPKDVLRLWLAIKNSFANHKGDPSREQVHELKYTLGLVELGFRGTIQVDGAINLLKEAGLNPEE